MKGAGGACCLESSCKDREPIKSLTLFRQPIRVIHGSPSYPPLSVRYFNMYVLEVLRGLPTCATSGVVLSMRSSLNLLKDTLKSDSDLFLSGGIPT